MGDLGKFQDAFSAALRGDTALIEPWLITPPSQAAGLAVYRNTVARGAIDALVATYSTVVSMVGEVWFRAAAAVYADGHRPATPSLLSYGADFPEWLSRFPPAADAPYLSGIARLDRLWWESYFAAEAGALDPGALSRLGAADLEATNVGLHPSVRLASFDQNLASLWLAHRDQDQPGDFEIAEVAECVLIVRAGMEVEARLIEPANYAFLVASRAGESLMAAAERATAIDPQVSLPDIIGSNLAAGVFTRLAAATGTRP